MESSGDLSESNAHGDFTTKSNNDGEMRDLGFSEISINLESLLISNIF